MNLVFLKNNFGKIWFNLFWKYATIATINFILNLILKNNNTIKRIRVLVGQFFMWWDDTSFSEISSIETHTKYDLCLKSQNNIIYYLLLFFMINLKLMIWAIQFLNPNKPQIKLLLLKTIHRDFLPLTFSATIFLLSWMKNSRIILSVLSSSFFYAFFC